MARIRTIKPEFFTSLTVADLPLTARLTFIGLWTHVDDEGRCVDDARLIKAAVWPLDDRTAFDVETDLKALTESSLITRYVVNEKRYMAVTNWREHQRINRPTPSNLPGPDQHESPTPGPGSGINEDSVSAHGGLNEDSPLERKGKEQGEEQGREQGERGARASKQHSTAPRPARKTLSLIPSDWQPNHNDVAAARADLDRLGPDATRMATAKFIRHHQAKATRAADFGPLWVSWLARERPEVAPEIPQQGAFLVPLPGGGTVLPVDAKTARRQAAREDLKRLGDELRAARLAQEGHTG